MMAASVGYYIEDGSGKEVKHVVSPDFARMVIRVLNLADDEIERLEAENADLKTAVEFWKAQAHG